MIPVYKILLTQNEFSGYNSIIVWCSELIGSFSSVDFDHSGSYLAVASSDIRSVYLSFTVSLVCGHDSSCKVIIDGFFDHKTNNW